MARSDEAHLEAVRRLAESIGLPDAVMLVERAARRDAVGFRRRAARAWDGDPESLPVRRNTAQVRLTYALCRAVDALEFYEQRGIDRDVFRATMGDIALRAELYRQSHGVLGLSMDDAVWLRHHFAASLFQLGSLQFQLFEMFPYELMEENGYMRFEAETKRRIPEGTPLINVHIPVRADLSPEACETSFSRAKAFFSEHFPEHRARAFFCFSWLLYPGMEQLLQKECNIRRFASRFHIIGISDDTGQALQRIYGKRDRDRADYPRDTTLQRAAWERRDCLGEACGVIEWSEE